MQRNVKSVNSARAPWEFWSFPYRPICPNRLVPATPGEGNAPYHKKQETYDPLARHRRYLEVFLLPPYWPELNEPERIWNRTRKHATHNRFFESTDELCRTLFRIFEQVRRRPQEIEGLLTLFI